MAFAPATERIPGVIHQHRRVRQGSGLQTSRRMLAIGARSASADASGDDVAQRITSRATSQDLFKTGSQLDLMCRAALATGILARVDEPRGAPPQLWAMPIAPLAGANVAATQTLTVSGTATAAGQLTAYVQDLAFSVRVNKDDTASTVAAAIDEAIESVVSDLAFTAGVAAAVVTLTAREPGLYGEELAVWIDDRDAPGISVAVARGANGTGTQDLTDALAASLEQDWDIIAICDSDATTRALVRTHIQSAWDYTTAKYPIVVMGHTGSLASAQTAVDDIDDFRGILASAEKNAGTGEPWDQKTSSRSHGFEVAASVAARLLTHERPNHNYNNASLSVSGRPRNLNRDNLNDAINAGVCVVLAGERTPGEIVDPVAATNTFDGSTDTRWQPIEIARTMQAITRSVGAELNTFPQSDGSEQTRRDARGGVFAVLKEAQGAGWVAAVEDTDVEASFETVGASTRLLVDLQYEVLTGTDIVEVTHTVVR